MEQKIIKEFLTSAECEQFFFVLDTILQCRAIEHQLRKKTEQDTQVNTFRKHMALLLHAQLCQNNVHQIECRIRHCVSLRNVLDHALSCQSSCAVKYCRTARRLALHFDSCRDPSCPICTFACDANDLKSEKPGQVFFNHFKSSINLNTDQTVKQINEECCGSIVCGDFNCNPFRMQNPPNKVGQPRTNSNPISK